MGVLESLLFYDRYDEKRKSSWSTYIRTRSARSSMFTGCAMSDTCCYFSACLWPASDPPRSYKSPTLLLSSDAYTGSPIIFSLAGLLHWCTLLLLYLPILHKIRGLLGEDPLDIESPAGSSRTYTGAGVTLLQFTAQHQAVLLAASREIFALEENAADAVAVDATCSDGSAADGARLEKLGRKKTRAALLATGVTGLLAGLYAGRHAIFSF